MERNFEIKQQFQALASELDAAKLNFLDCNRQRIQANQNCFRNQQTIDKLEAQIAEYGQITFDLGQTNQVLRQQINFLKTELTALEKSKLNPALPPVAESLINNLLGQAKRLTSEQLCDVLRKMGARELTQFRLLTEIQKLRSDKSPCQESSESENFYRDIAALVRGDARDIDQLRKELSYEKDKFFAVCFTSILGVIVFWSGLLALF